ncbi:hypothetical protein HDV04_001269 [Boothiomyces sp. JEL0838]|nr:hypothetical protein HDV04_001269 [Boothiomyces sp. JEL0838]
MDYKKFQADLLNDSGIEEKNSNDAGAESVQIIFNIASDSSKSSQFSLPWLHKTNVESVTYKNNGKAFSEEDFGRLRKIAEGNPDEQKIGFFGVGFYSLFSICEEPFISSGEHTMGFLWKKDMLYTKRGKVPTELVNPWTVFYLPCREPFPVPDMRTFAKFLVTSLAFSTNIVNVKVFIGDSLKIRCTRKAARPKEIEWNKKVYNLYSPQKLFKLKDLTISQIQMDLAMVDESDESYTVFMKIVSGELDVNLPRKLTEEMLRTTKKLPPKSTSLKLLYSNFEEYDSTLQASKGSSGIFEDLIVSPGKQGKVFIGFPTFQTTGSCVHLAAHLIPTVERESIDFVDQVLRLWNSDLLSVGGTLARICNDYEVNQIQILLGNMTLDSQSKSFIDCTSEQIKILSSTGKFHSIDNVRLSPDADVQAFLKLTPFIPAGIHSKCTDFIEKYKKLGILRNVSISDVLVEVQQRSMETEELLKFMKWWINQGKAGVLSQRDIQILKSNLLYSNAGEVIQLGVKDKIASVKLQPRDFPTNCIPIELTQSFHLMDLSNYFWNWEELKLKDWVAHVSTRSDLANDPEFAEKVLTTVAKIIGHLSLADRAFITSTLSSKKCIPTQLGMVYPREAYFSNVSLFEDLPKVRFSHKKQISDDFLISLGVRQHVELQLVFDRIIDLQWDQTQLIKYLGSIQDKMTDKELSTLRSTPLFLAANSNSEERLRASELYTPNDVFKNFGLPVLLWTSKWKFFSEEANFMKKIGLNFSIPLDNLLVLISKKDGAERLRLIRYLVDNMESEYKEHYKPSQITTKFLPCQNSTALATPLECYSDQRVELMGLNVVDKSIFTYSEKLGVAQSPNGTVLIQQLKSNLPTPANASSIFEFLSSRQSIFTSSNWKELWSLKFIPVKNQEGYFHAAPTQVYLKPNDNSNEQYAGIFHYVTFGASADAFLRACGMKDQPSPLELAENIVQDPIKFLQNLQSNYQSYLEIIRILAANSAQIQQRSQIYKLLKTSPCLPAYQYNEEGGSDSFRLAIAKDIYLIDDTVVAQLFKPLGAPMEEVLERFYADLGSDWLSKHVKENYSPEGSLKITQVSIDLQNTILERAPILLYDGHQMRSERELNKNASSLLGAIKVMEIPRINIIRTFKDVSKKQETTASFVSLKGETILSVTEHFDYFDVARVIGGMLLKKPRLSDSLLISTFLSTSLQNLSRKGFPVDRILNLKQKPKTVEYLPVQSQKSETPKVVPPSLHVPDITPKKEIQSPPRKKSNDFFGMVKNFTKSLGLRDSIDSMNTSSESFTESKEEVVKKPSISRSQRLELAKQLEQSISSVKNTNESNFKAQFPSLSNAPPVIHLCNVLSDQDLSLVTTVDSIPIFVDKNVSEEGNHIIQNNLEGISSLSDEIKIPFPEMFFGNNRLEVTTPKKILISFNAVDALKMVDDSHDSADRIKVAISEKWTNASLKNHTGIKNIIKPYDWTYTTLYKGTCPEVFTQGSTEIDLSKLTSPDPILFYDEVLLFEDELGDNGTSILSIKVKLPFTPQGPDLAQLGNINWVAGVMNDKHLIARSLENHLVV